MPLRSSYCVKLADLPHRSEAGRGGGGGLGWVSVVKVRTASTWSSELYRFIEQHIINKLFYVVLIKKNRKYKVSIVFPYSIIKPARRTNFYNCFKIVCCSLFKKKIEIRKFL